MTDYLVRTDVYSGPMDLLLFLIRRNEIDIYDIPVARVTEQYVQHVEMLRTIDPNVAGEFLVLAAMLMEIKSRMLLPRPPAEEGAEEEDLSDPRLELVRQLLEYKKFKDASFALAEKADTHAARWPRSPVRMAPAPAGELDIEDVQVWDLVAAFNRLMQSIGVRPATHDVVFDDTPIALHAVDILDRLVGDQGRMTFDQVFSGRNKSEMIGLFLALLELIRQKRVRVVQDRAFGPIVVELLSAEPIEVGEDIGGALRSSVLGDAENRVEPQDEETGGRGESMGGGGNARRAETARADFDDGTDEDELSFPELDSIKTDVDMSPSLPRDTADAARPAPEDDR